MREYHSFNHILECNEMNEREGRKRLNLRIHKRNEKGIVWNVFVSINNNNADTCIIVTHLSSPERIKFVKLCVCQE